ncbi:MAG: hypothetical protein ACRET2_06545 [Steroidobacteraceae bacterium]
MLLEIAPQGEEELERRAAEQVDQEILAEAAVGLRDLGSQPGDVLFCTADAYRPPMSRAAASGQCDQKTPPSHEDHVIAAVVPEASAHERLRQDHAVMALLPIGVGSWLHAW